MAQPTENRREANRASSYKIVTWNSGGLNAKRENGRKRGDFLLSLWNKEGNLGVMAVQETHCKSDYELCQSVIDMKARLHVIHSPAGDDDPRAGVLLVLTHDWEVIETVREVPGRVMSVRVKSRVFDESMNFVVVYGKSGGSDGGEWIDGLARVLTDDYENVVIGDFNFVEKPEDRRGREISGLNGYDISLTNKFHNATAGWELKDIFRESRGEETGFTYCHECGWQSRIDRVYSDPDFLAKVSELHMQPFLGETTGHQSVWLKIEEGLKLGKGYWKFNVSLLRDRAYTEEITETWNEARDDKEDFNNIGEWWDYAKRLMTSATISYATNKRQNERREVKQLEKEKAKAEEAIENGDEFGVAAEQLKEINHRLEQEEERKAEGCRIRSRVPNFESKEPGVAYFSTMEKRGSKRNLIYALKDENGSARTGTQEVVGIAEDFYRQLFSRGETDEQTQNEFLSKVDVGLDEEGRRWCDRVIEKTEVESVMKKMASGKSPWG